MRRLRFAALVSACAALAATTADASPAFDRSGWLADLRQTRDAMSAGYANLEWAVAVRGMDLKAVYAEAEHGIEAAKDDAAARKALDRLTESFADGHLEIRWKSAATEVASTPAPLCDRLGYFDAGDAGGIATHAKVYASVGDRASHFPAGILTVADKRIGVLRIPIFGPQGFPDLCAPMMRAAKLTPQSPCDEACSDRVSVIADNFYLRELEVQLKAVIAARPDVLLVDAAGNGGGDNTSIALARMLSAKHLAAPRMGFVRSKAWAAQFADDSAIRKAIAKAHGRERIFLRSIEARIRVARAEAEKPCDRTPLWRDEPPGCSQVVDTPRYASGYTPHELPPAWRHKAWASEVSTTAALDYTPHLWAGPLIVLVDGGSASSTELFAAMLQDNHAALILGAPTYGAGCGHASGAEPITLAHSGAKFSMPDCVRLRANGRDEVGGIEPDVLIGFHRRATPVQRARRLEAALPAAIARVTAP